MTVPRSTVEATIAVALKKMPAAVRKALASRSWQEREIAEQEITSRLADAMGHFDIGQKPMQVENRMDRI